MVIGGFCFEAFGNINPSGQFDKIYVLAAILVVLNIAGMPLGLL